MKDPCSDEAHPPNRGFLRGLLIVAGFVSLGLGTLGVLLPVLPTTPFVLLTAACFARASPRFYRWLLDTRIFGPSIRRWRTSRTVSVRTKVTAISLIVISMGTSVIFFVKPLGGRIAMVALAVAVTVLLIRLPTRR